VQLTQEKKLAIKEYTLSRNERRRVCRIIRQQPGYKSDRTQRLRTKTQKKLVANSWQKYYSLSGSDRVKFIDNLLLIYNMNSNIKFSKEDLLRMLRRKKHEKTRREKMTYVGLKVWRKHVNPLTTCVITGLFKKN
jgi:hypothetical protein